jgi:hypothetical protein
MLPDEPGLPGGIGPQAPLPVAQLGSPLVINAKRLCKPVMQPLQTLL